MKTNLQKEFDSALAVFVLEKGEYLDLRIQTKVGPLELMFYDSKEGPWIAARFVDIDQARKHFGVKENDFRSRLNPCSGKWNWHWHEFEPVVSRHIKSLKQAGGQKMIAAFVAEVQKTLMLRKAN